MPFQIDAAVLDIAKGFLPYFLGLLIIDVIMILLIRRFRLPRLKHSKPDHEVQITNNIRYSSDEPIYTDQPSEAITSGVNTTPNTNDIRPDKGRRLHSF